MKRTVWIACRILFLCIVAIAFSSLVIPEGKPSPTMWGMPRTLWAGLLVSLAFILLTVVGALVINSDKKKNS